MKFVIALKIALIYAVIADFDTEAGLRSVKTLSDRIFDRCFPGEYYKTKNYKYD